MRMIVVFEKGLVLRHIGHLDLMRAMQRALRRSGLPLQYSNGFNPHIQISFALPLSVGIVGLRELMDVPIVGEYDPQAFAQTLGRALPGSLRVLRARAVADDFPSLMALASGSRYRIQFGAGEAEAQVAAAAGHFMEAGAYQAMRKTKSAEKMTDIRPFVRELTMEQTDEGYTLRCDILNRQEGSLKPAVLMGALCALAQVEPIHYIAYRETILANKKDGEAIPLEEYANA
ncbi:MAG: TIGR03936 family radical SAM-associated protein [Eubacteriales bacterium]|nr:TIGR03936 family radical SAM-associated protein [Eubacteriales bacterium]